MSGCGGACSIPLPNTPPPPPRHDGNCCDKCAHDDAKAKAFGHNPMLRMVHGMRPPMGAMMPQQLAGVPMGRMASSQSMGPLISVRETIDDPMGMRSLASMMPEVTSLRRFGMTCDRWQALTATTKQEWATDRGLTAQAIDGECRQVMAQRAQMQRNEAMAVSAAPEGKGGGHGDGRGRGDGFRGYYPQVQPAVFLSVMGDYPCSWWWRLAPTQKQAYAMQFEATNPGSVGDVTGFIARMDAHCAATLGGGVGYPTYGYGGLGLALRPAYGLGSSGTVNWSGSGVYYTYGTDSNGVTWDVDANGDPIPGSGATADGTSVPDSQYTGTGMTYGQEILSPTGGGSTGGSGISDAATRAILTDVGQLITAAGTDVSALINAGSREALATINANLQMVLHNCASGTCTGVDGQAISPAQLAQLRQLAAMNTLPRAAPPVSTPVAIGIGAVALGILAKLVGWI